MTRRPRARKRISKPRTVARRDAPARDASEASRASGPPGPRPPAGPIRGSIDGVDYSNAPSVRNALGDYIALTEGNWMTGQGDPDTPSLKEGADLNDVILFAEGDFPIATPVFQETATWSPGRILSLDLNEGSAAS